LFCSQEAANEKAEQTILDLVGENVHQFSDVSVLDIIINASGGGLWMDVDSLMFFSLLLAIML
jgi:hypothetical protein